MAVTIKKLTVGFRNIEEALGLLGDTLKEMATKISFKYSDEIISVIDGLTSELVPFTYAQILERMEVRFAGEEIDVELEYCPEPDEEDELDVSFLSLLSDEAEKLTLGVVLSDKEYASYLGADKLVNLATDHVDVLMVMPQSDMSEENSELSSEGGDDNGNEG